ncbi:hypothetical protein BDZ91DRAFT_759184 [Kalaharituber pfeilii]|nr:hypothetical protein BDZ91DRAFT_759184 [Kalaharituber pfeilii]
MAALHLLPACFALFKFLPCAGDVSASFIHMFNATFNGNMSLGLVLRCRVSFGEQQLSAGTGQASQTTSVATCCRSDIALALDSVDPEEYWLHQPQQYRQRRDGFGQKDPHHIYIYWCPDIDSRRNSFGRRMLGQYVRTVPGIWISWLEYTIGFQDGVQTCKEANEMVARWMEGSLGTGDGGPRRGGD